MFLLLFCGGCVVAVCYGVVAVGLFGVVVVLLSVDGVFAVCGVSLSLSLSLLFLAA